MLIVLEGPDASGKSTVGRAVAKALEADFIEFPNDEGVTGPLIRAYLSKQWRLEMDEVIHQTWGKLRDTADALTFQALQSTNRMEFMTRIRHAKHMVLARYWQSGHVYGSLDGLSPEFLKAIHAEIEQPDLNILLDLSAEESIERIGKRGVPPDRYEIKRSVLEKVRSLYQGLWAEHVCENPVGQEWDWPIIDASQDLADVVAQVMCHVVKALEAEYA